MGEPRFKEKGYYRSFTFLARKQDCLQDKRINLATIVPAKLIQNRSIIQEFPIKLTNPDLTKQ